ncbi:MAG: CHAT domain-containing protein, partial [Myxococcota bacterium]|nr:CHAT domain-containing protein [Myxococcota bacterium]
ARVALAAGRPGVAREAAAAARAVSEGEVAADAAWLEGWGALGQGDADGATAAAGALRGARAQALRGLALGYAGAPGAVFGGLPESGLSARDTAYVWLEAGRLGGPLATESMQRAVRAADASGDPALSMATRLELEAQLRAFDERGAASLRAQLLKAAPRGSQGDALRAEVGLRAMLAGGSLTSGEDVSGPVAEWIALASGEGVAEPTTAVGRWANGRSAARGGEAAASLRYAESLTMLPTHRRGVLSTGTALLGAHGVPVAADLAMVQGKQLDDASLAVALTIHEAVHRVDAARADHAQGRDLLAGLEAEQRASLLEAAAFARAQVRDHLAGGGGFPEASFKALAAAEAALRDDTPLRTVLPAAPLSLGQVRKDLSGAALLSYVASPDSVHGLVVKLDGGSALTLGPRAAWVADAASHLRALQGSARTDAKADHRAGDRLRSLLIDPFVADLAGVGRYQVVAPLDVMGFSVTTFPEQSSGLRYLADIRTVATLPTIASAHDLDDDKSASFDFRPPFLGFGAPEEAAPPPEPAAEDGEAAAEAAGDEPAEPGDATAKPGPATEAADPEAQTAGSEFSGGLTDADLLRAHRSKSKTPGALVAASRSFGDDFRDLRVGQAATEAIWTELGGTARYLQFSKVDAAPDGGFVLADGVLTLSDIRSTEMHAQVVVITAEAPHPVQLQRARAFLDAGSKAVLVMAWPIEEAAQERFFDGYFAALNRDRPPARALNEARESLMRDALLGVDNDDPGLWGSMLLLSTP